MAVSPSTLSTLETAGIRGFAGPRVKADKSDFNIRIVTGE
jgi:hypothetical protein